MTGKFWNVYGRDCYGRFFYRGQVFAATPREALMRSRMWRRAVLGNVVTSQMLLTGLRR